MFSCTKKSKFWSTLVETNAQWNKYENCRIIYFWKRSNWCMYVVWQKSNETDFLLTMNFILFTNQGYSLRNSSLGQLHSDGGFISIVRSSAGRLLLEYLSARRLRSSGYYPKYQNGALSSGFWAGGIKRSHRDWDLANRGAEEPQECFFSAKN